MEFLLDSLNDTLKLIPFLFLTFFIMEKIEGKIKREKVIERKGFLAPIISSILGILPQCGFGVAATNLYAARIISVGSLIAVYLSTSDEMLPILISKGVPLELIFKIIFIKLFIAIVCGIVIDLVFAKRKKTQINNICEETNCNCHKGENIFFSTIKHTLNIAFFIFIISFILNIVMEFLGPKILSDIFYNNGLITPFIVSIIGLIPNCAASVLIVELYLSEILSFGSMIAGLLTGAGVSTVILFKSNKNFKENLSIILFLYFIVAIAGVILNLIL